MSGMSGSGAAVLARGQYGRDETARDLLHLPPEQVAASIETTRLAVRAARARRARRLREWQRWQQAVARALANGESPAAETLRMAEVGERLYGEAGEAEALELATLSTLTTVQDAHRRRDAAGASAQRYRERRDAARAAEARAFSARSMGPAERIGRAVRRLLPGGKVDAGEAAVQG